MTVKRLLSFLLLCISLVGILGSLSLKLLLENNVGPGFAPLLYSACLGICSAVLLFQKDAGKKIDFSQLFRKPGFDSTFFYLMLFVSYGMAILIGMLPSLGVFSITVLLQQKKLTRQRAIAFEVVFILFVYLLFTKLLKVPFERGLLLR